MQRKQHEIRISETGAEYLLFIPANQRQRAKRVEPIRFDFSRRCWVYDRNLSNYYALIREFADDLTLSSSFTNPQEDEERSYLSDTLSEMDDTISTQDDEIKSLKAAVEQKDRQNSELQEEIDRLHGIAKGIHSLDERLSNKDDEIQLLNDAIGERNRKNNQLNRQIDQLKAEINNHKTTIDDLSQTLSEKDGEIQSFSDAVDEKDRENSQLRTQITQLQDINTHPGIRDIVLEATGNDPEFRKFNIDEYLPIALEEWLETHLNQALGRRNVDLYNLIDNHIDCEGEKLNPDEFDYSDRHLAYVIRTQRNVLAHPKEMKKETGMARILCCFFAAALLPSKRPKPKQPAFR